MSFIWMCLCHLLQNVFQIVQCECRISQNKNINYYDKSNMFLSFLKKKKKVNLSPMFISYKANTWRHDRAGFRKLYMPLSSKFPKFPKLVCKLF